MNRYLARLRDITGGSEGFEGDQGRGIPKKREAVTIEAHPENFKKPIPTAPSKPSKPGFEGFEGDRGSRFSNFAEALDALERHCPDHVEAERWQQCVEDARRFLASWGDQAEALGWTAGELFGLHEPPAKPHPSYSRLSRYEYAGLLWLLKGRPVVALTATEAAIQAMNAVLMYRKASEGK